MSKERICLVGHDDDNGAMGLIIIIIVIMVVVTIMVYGGAFIGGFHSIKNYILAFKHNVVDSNRNLRTA